ncbi:Egg protein, partial [Schistosoma japonicum]
YIESRSVNFYERGWPIDVDVKRGNGLFMEDIGFQVTVNQFSYRSALIFKSGKALTVYWKEMHFCQSHPDASNGTIVQEKVIYNSVLLDFMTSGLITFIPQKRCLEQTTEDECIAESQQNVSCTWCAECGKCSG